MSYALRGADMRLQTHRPRDAAKGLLSLRGHGEQHPRDHGEGPVRQDHHPLEEDACFSVVLGSLCRNLQPKFCELQVAQRQPASASWHHGQPAGSSFGGSWTFGHASWPYASFLVSGMLWKRQRASGTASGPSRSTS